MFPDPNDYAVQLESLGLDPTNPEAAELVFLLAGFLGHFADGTHPSLSPVCADSGAVFMTEKAINVVESQQHDARSHLSYTFGKAVQQPPTRKEPL